MTPEHTDHTSLPQQADSAPATMPVVVDQVALARLYGEPLFSMPTDLYIPPDALEVFLEAFEGPLDLLLYLIRKQNFNILDIPMAGVTRQYLSYVDEIRQHNLELAAEYLLMAAMLIEIKSRMLLPPKKVAEGEEAEDPRAELVRRLLEYEQMKLAAQRLAAGDRGAHLGMAVGVAESVGQPREIERQRTRLATAHLKLRLSHAALGRARDDSVRPQANEDASIGLARDRLAIHYHQSYQLRRFRRTRPAFTMEPARTLRVLPMWAISWPK